MENKRSFDTYETTVEVAELLTPRNIHLRFRLPEGKEMNYKSGQFVQIFVPQEADKPLRRSYSIASAPKDPRWFELCVTLVDGGKGSSYLHSLKPGQKVQVMGPLGKFSYPEKITRDLVFIATGSGIAPMRSMIDNLIDKNLDKSLYLLYGNRYDNDIIYKNEWESLEKEHDNFKICLTLSRPEKWQGPKGYVGDKIKEFIPDPINKDFYICGLSDMINDVQSKLLDLGIPKDQIHFEKYD
ncbi:MAG: ferredoxin--NADP reductase [Elusimicrobiota bacterium]